MHRERPFSDTTKVDIENLRAARRFRPLRSAGEQKRGWRSWLGRRLNFMTRWISLVRRLQAEATCSLTRFPRNRFGLTPTEAAVAHALADGVRYREIAKQFCISYHTAHTHVNAIHQKVGVSSNGRLLALIRKEGWG